MKKNFADKIWAWAMNNVIVSACLGTLALGLVAGAICTVIEMIFC